RVRPTPIWPEDGIQPLLEVLVDGLPHVVAAGELVAGLGHAGGPRLIRLDEARIGLYPLVHLVHSGLQLLPQSLGFVGVAIHLVIRLTLTTGAVAVAHVDRLAGLLVDLDLHLGFLLLLGAPQGLLPRLALTVG